MEMLVKNLYSFCFFQLLFNVNLSAQQPRLVVPIGHTSGVNFATFSLDGKYIATASWDKTAKIWNAADGKLLIELIGHTGAINTANFSPDGKTIVTASNDNTAKIWNVSNGKLLIELIGHTSSVQSANFSHDGKTIITSSVDRTIKTWSASTGKLIADWTKEKMYIVAVSPDGENVVTGSQDSYSDWRVRIWRLVDNTLIQELVGHSSAIRTATFSPDGKYLITTSADSTVKIWNIRKGNLIGELQSSSYYSFNSANYSPDGKNIVTTESHIGTKIWNATNGNFIKKLTENKQASFAAYSLNGKYIIEAGGFAPKILNATDGEIAQELKGHSNYVYSSRYSPDGKYIVTTYGGGTNGISPKIWNPLTGNVIGELQGGMIDYGMDAEFSPDGKYVIISGGKAPDIWSMDDRKFVRKLDSQSPWIYHSAYSQDGKYIVTANENNIAELWDAATGNLIRKFIGHSKWVLNSSFSPDNKYIVTSSADYTARVWNVANGDSLLELNGHTGSVVSAVYSPDGKFILTAAEDSTARIWNATNGKLIKELLGHASYVNTAIYSPDGIYIATASLDGTIKIWNAIDGSLQNNFQWKNGEVNSAMFSPDGKSIIATYKDHTTKIWNILKDKESYTFFLVDSSYNISYIPSGYYQCSQTVSKLLHYVTKDLKVITFEQLDVKYNRPDKVLEAIGNTDTALIKSYRKAWEKRIKKLGIDTTAFRDGYSVPEADFTNRDAIEYEQKAGTLKLLIKGNDSTYKLDRFNVWVNETPVFGQRGINIRKRNRNDFDTTITIKLSQGENRIETSITNVNGTESYRMPLTVNYTPAIKQKESVRFIGIGIDQFADNKYNLQYSTKDIRDLSKKLKEKYKGDIIIDTLFNENVTTSNVKALKQKLQQTTENDKVIVAYSGHGMLNKEYDYYLSTYSVNFDKPEEGGLPYDELESLLDSIPTRKKLMLIDACHSGEVDKEDLVTLNASSDSLIKGLKPVAYKQEGHLGLKNSFELMQSLFVNVGKSTGATIISAAAGTQFALERNDLKNGVFTYSILEAMNKYPTLKISELKKIVGQRVEELTKGLQKPTSRNEMITVDWNVW